MFFIREENYYYHLAFLQVLLPWQVVTDNIGQMIPMFSLK